jgi:hypothetical protein
MKMLHLSVAAAALLLAAPICLTTAWAAPKVVIISLDGATPRLVDQYTASGALPPNEGLRLLQAQGVKADRNTTIFPSLTAPAHIAIATGAPAASNDIIANSFRLTVSPFSAGTISGFAAPIGGYLIDGPAESPEPSAEPLWIALRNAGRVVATATWPGGDGIDVRVPGRTRSCNPRASGRSTTPCRSAPPVRRSRKDSISPRRTSAPRRRRPSIS